ncbi:uncharacterized protein LOC62_03G005118 [Vanrija pseudolonga]|uniref:Uncharacterized protein n=1 Tax=Vanrija pseudolonga TaxID=143232 RepID=A0AAF1BHW2_9TREE|nr:hypothetical protein LOC62_03G005118 [Vanrija pseudolonga]
MYSPPPRGYHVPSGLRSTLATAESHRSPPSRSSSPPSPSPHRESSINLPYLVPRSSIGSTPAHSPPARSASVRTDYTSSSSAASSYSDESVASSPEPQRQARAGAPSPATSPASSSVVGMIAFPTPRTRPELRVDTGVQPSPPRRIPGQGGTQHSRVRGSSMSMVPSTLRASTQPRQFTRSVSASHAPVVDSSRPARLPFPRPRTPTMPTLMSPVELVLLVKSAQFRADIPPQACPEVRLYHHCNVAEDAEPTVQSPAGASKQIHDPNVIILSHVVTFTEEMPAPPAVKVPSPTPTWTSPGSMQAACAEQLQTLMTPSDNVLGMTFVATPEIDYSRLEEYTVSPEPSRHTVKSRRRRVACAAIVFQSLTDDDLDHIDRCWKSLSLGHAVPPDTTGMSKQAVAAAEASYDHIMGIVVDAGRAAKKLGCPVLVSNQERTFQVCWDGLTQPCPAVSETFGYRRDASTVRAGQGFGLCEMMAATAWARMQVGVAY